MPKLGEAPLVHEGAALTDTVLGRWTEVGAGTKMLGVRFGDYSYCARLCDVAHTHVGKFANIASMVRVGATDHPLDRASLHHFMYRATYYWDDAEDEAAVFAARAARVAHVGHDTWLGHACIIKPGVTVGDGAVVGSGAVVTKNVAPYTIVAGNPARLLRLRQPPEVAARLQALAWWDWDHALLRATLDDFRSLSAVDFLARYEG